MFFALHEGVSHIVKKLNPLHNLQQNMKRRGLRTGVGEPEATRTSSTVRQELDDGVSAACVERLRQTIRLQSATVPTTDGALCRRHPHQVGR